MSPVDYGTEHGGVRPPRARGDEPEQVSSLPLPQKSSPRSRGSVFVNDVETTGQDFCVRASWGSVVVMVLWGRLIQASAGGAGACGGRVNRCGF